MRIESEGETENTMATPLGTVSYPYQMTVIDTEVIQGRLFWRNTMLGRDREHCIKSLRLQGIEVVEDIEYNQLTGDHDGRE